MPSAESDPNPFDPPRDPAASSVSVTAPSARRSLIPPFAVRLIAAAFVLSAGIVRWFTISGDHAIVNILTFLCGMLACLTLGIWFTFFSGYRRSVRWGGTFGIIGVIALFFIVYRVENVSGELVPTFRPRWVKRADEMLNPAAPADSAVVADLADHNQR